MGWIDSIRGNIVGLDTAPLIYYTEENIHYMPVVEPFFSSLALKDFVAITSMISLLEVLVRPIREDDSGLAQRYRDFLLNSINLSTIPVSQEIAEEAARLRAIYKLRTPDAIQLATAIVEGASFFLTNDAHFPSMPEIKVLVLDDLIKVP